MHFQLTYDALRGWRGELADVEYVRFQYLASDHRALVTMASDGGQRPVVAAGSRCSPSVYAPGCGT